MKVNNFNSNSCASLKLKNILLDRNECFFFHIPNIKTPIHPHYTILMLLLCNIKPQKIAIFDHENKNYIYQSICEIIYSFELDSYCTSNFYNPTNTIHPDLIQYFSSHTDLSQFHFIYIENTTQSFAKAPILSEITNNLPQDSIIVINNSQSQHILAQENNHFINKWKTIYPHLELFHHHGLIIFYTGKKLPDSLSELFDLKNDPVLLQRFRKRCAFIDQHWQMYNCVTENQSDSEENKLLESKIQHHLSERKVKYLQKELDNLYKTINRLLIWKEEVSQKNIPDIPFPPSIKLPDKSNLSTVFSSHPTDKENCYRPRRIIFIAGEPNTPGVVYRCHRNAKACIMSGHEAKVINAADINPSDIQWADVLILWRVEYSGHIAGIINLSKEWGTITAFDADDIVFKPHFAHIEIIDGIRSIGATETETAHTFHNMRQTLMRTDFAVATTKEMRTHMAQELIPKHAGPLIFILPNIFDDECVALSRFASRIIKQTKDNHLIRIGYASGTRTHQRDFAIALPALISIFKQRPNVRLVLFREPQNHRPILHMHEFPELAEYQEYIEWRDTVPLERLPQEIARFDISIAPLEADNVFCNAKSELKFFEAALANVSSVVSPTGPLKRCIQHGITGFLANTSEEWENYLLKLIDNQELRKEIAQHAYHSVLWTFSMQRQSKLCDMMLLSLTNETGATKAAETIFSRGDYKNYNLPIIPKSDILFEHDALKDADVTVVITSYNYGNYIIEAMESVKLQTLQYIDLIVVDDGSSDNSITLITEWMKHNKKRFNRLQLHKSVQNAGLGGARNIGIAASETLYSMQLDADNRLLPDTCEKLLNALKGTAIGYAYPYISHFGAGETEGGLIPFNPLRLSVGNYIDAMVMLAKWAWAATGGFYVKRDAMGWEDYDMWCRCAELSIAGTQVLDAVGEYRAHTESMTNTLTEQNHHKPKVVSYLSERHHWINIVTPEESPWKDQNK